MVAQAQGQSAQNPFYDFMREAAPGDEMVSFADTLIRAIGLAASHAREAPKLPEFGQSRAYWDRIGWRVDVRCTELRLPIRPADHMAVLGTVATPLIGAAAAHGNGLQSVYLTLLPDRLAAALVDVMGADTHALVLGYHLTESGSDSEAAEPSTVGLVKWEQHELTRVQAVARVSGSGVTMEARLVARVHSAAHLQDNSLLARLESINREAQSTPSSVP